jgi:hypothetical protein
MKLRRGLLLEQALSQHVPGVNHVGEVLAPVLPAERFRAVRAIGVHDEAGSRRSRPLAFSSLSSASGQPELAWLPCS